MVKKSVEYSRGSMENCKRKYGKKNWKSKAKAILERSKPNDLKVGQKVLLKENQVIGRAKLQDKYKSDQWVIEEVLDDRCGLFKIRPVGFEFKIIHRSNVRPIKSVIGNKGETIENEEEDEYNDELIENEAKAGYNDKGKENEAERDNNDETSENGKKR